MTFSALRIQSAAGNRLFLGVFLGAFASWRFNFIDGFRCALPVLRNPYPNRRFSRAIASSSRGSGLAKQKRTMLVSGSAT